MKPILKKIEQNPIKSFFIIFLIVIFPALIFNLGKLPLIEDEAIRGLVAFEMIKSGDFVTPTLGGELYFKKPPLFNWLVGISYGITGQFNEFSIRMTMVISLLLFSLLIYYFIKKEMGKKLAFLNAVMVITCGRILFYETLYGLIDITFSLVTYAMFMLTYYFMKHKKYGALFFSAYFLTSIGYLLKGLPALVFLGITLLTVFIANRKFLKLFYWKHFVAFGVLLSIVGTYYLFYFLKNNIAPNELFETVFMESAKRTPIDKGIQETIIHLFSFPFEMIGHFMPWTLLVICFLKKGLLKKARQHPFLKYNMQILFFNIIVYWLSPEVYPRYLLMFLPLFFINISWAYSELKKENSVIIKWVDIILGIMVSFFVLVPYIALFEPSMKNIPNILLISIVISALVLIGVAGYWKQSGIRLFWLATLLFIFRIGFNFMVIPGRLSTHSYQQSKIDAFELAELTYDKDLFVWWSPDVEYKNNYYKKRVPTYHFMYYLSAGRDRILDTQSEIIPEAYYIGFKNHIKGYNTDLVTEVTPAGGFTVPLQVFEFKVGEEPASND